MPSISGILATVKDLVAIDQTIQSVIQQSNQSRSVILEIDNYTDMTLRKVDEHHDHGNWAATPRGEIPPQKAMVFGSQSKAWSIMTDTEGYITYDGDNVKIIAKWDNSFIGG